MIPSSLDFDRNTHYPNFFTSVNKPRSSIDLASNRTKPIQYDQMNDGGTNRLLSKNIHDEEIGTSGYYSHLENQE